MASGQSFSVGRVDRLEAMRLLGDGRFESHNLVK